MFGTNGVIVILLLLAMGDYLPCTSSIASIGNYKRAKYAIRVKINWKIIIHASMLTFPPSTAVYKMDAKRGNRRNMLVTISKLNQITKHKLIEMGFFNFNS